jgi:hypothetical protein
MKNKNAAILVVLAGLTPVPAIAGRPAVTDDARLLDEKACQLETWFRRIEDATTYYFMPACNPGFGELHVGGAWTHAGGQEHLSDVALQFKTLLKPWEGHGWSMALSLGTDRLAGIAKAGSWPGDYYLNVPFTVGNDETWLLHVNAGALRQRETGKTVGTWGLAAEFAASPGLTVIPETFGSDRGRPFYQLGVAYELVKNRVQVDGSFGNRASSGSAERYFTIGLKLQSPPFLP